MGIKWRKAKRGGHTIVRTGLAVLIETRLDLLAGQRVGLVSHSASVLPDLSGILDALLAAGVNVRALFGAEHGFAGAALDGAEVGNTIDHRSGLPVFSLYGAVKEPLPAMLAGLDALVVDFQDVGARFYTYISTLYYVLRSAGQAGIPVFVLDRPNPINGVAIEGPPLQPGFESFIGILPVPVRHGLTFGELALLMNRSRELKAPLTVIPMQGWQRGLWYDQTGLPWVILSPGMPHLSTAIVYPGMCFLEGTNLSEGRGTALPFEVAGAPWLDGPALAERLNHLELLGARFRPITFRPTASKFAGQFCEGVQVHVLERDQFQAVRTGLHVLAACRDMAPDSFAFLPSASQDTPSHFDLLAGSAGLRERLETSISVEDCVESWKGDLESFAQQRKPYLLYP